MFSSNARRLLIWVVLVALCALAPVRGNAQVFIPAVPQQGNERFVGTRGYVATQQVVGYKSFMSRTSHVMRGTTTAMRTWLWNGYVLTNGVGEAGSGSSGTITMSLEYPSGTCTPLTFSGNSSYTIANNELAATDFLASLPPVGSQYWIRIWGGNFTNIVTKTVPGGTGNPVGDAYTASNSGNVTDQTVSCTAVTNSFPTIGYYPMAMTGISSSVAYATIGDSIAYGYAELTEGPTGDVGIVDRSAGTYFGYSNLSAPGTLASVIPSTMTVRQKMFQFATTVVNQSGLADLAIGSTSAQVLSFQGQVYSLIRAYGKRVVQTTLTPEATSTDNFVLQSNETTKFLNADRNAVNAVTRATGNGIDGFIETSNPIEPSQGSGIFVVNGVTACPSLNVACDGTHPTTPGSILIQNAVQPTITTVIQYLLRRDVLPDAANDNTPMFLDQAA